MLAAAGCLRPGAQEQGFDGEAALRFAAGLVEAGGETHRVPGTPGHAAAARWLWEQADVPGWERGWHNVTPRLLAEIPGGGVAAYLDRCPDDDKRRVGNVTFHNIFLTQRHAGESAGLVLLAAHWDSKQQATSDPDPAKRDRPVPGANDGASGVGVLLQLARELGPGPFQVGIVFFDGEDGFEDCHALAGSRAYARDLPQGRPQLLILLDMVGDPDARFPREESSLRVAPKAVDFIWGRAEAHGLGENFVRTTRSVFDDHTPFVERSIPAVDIIDFARPDWSFPPYWHTTEDTVDKLDAGMMGRIGDLLLDVLDEPELLADSADVPA